MPIGAYIVIAGIKKIIELKYLNYEFKEGSDDTLIIKNETHFDLTPLLKALQYYADHYDEWDDKVCREFWCTVIGLLQTLSPLYIRQHYCDPEEAFHPTPTFDKKKFKRCLDFENWVTSASSWKYDLLTVVPAKAGIHPST